MPLIRARLVVQVHPGPPFKSRKIKPGSHAWALNEEESQHFLRQSLDLGINFFDTANVYSAGPAKRSLGDFWVHMLDAKPLSSRLRCMPRCATSRMAKASRAKKSFMNSTRACVVSEPTTWTCIKSTGGITRIGRAHV